MILECYNLLKSIEKRPEMFVGKVSLNHINIFISGYYLGITENGIIEVSREESFHE